MVVVKNQLLDSRLSHKCRIVSLHRGEGERIGELNLWSILSSNFTLRRHIVAVGLRRRGNNQPSERKTF